MKLDLPSRNQEASENGRVAPGLYAFLDAVRRTLLGTGTIPQLPAFDITSLPDAAATPRGMIYVVGAPGTKNPAFSNGGAWYYFDGTAV